MYLINAVYTHVDRRRVSHLVIKREPQHITYLANASRSLDHQDGALLRASQLVHAFVDGLQLLLTANDLAWLLGLQHVSLQ